MTTDTIKKKKPCLRCSDTKGFSNIYWWNNMSNFAQTVIIMGYLQFAEEVFVKKYGYTEKAAALWTPVPFLMISLISPFAGALIDKIGNRLTFAVVFNAVPALAMLWAMATPECDDACWPAVFPMLLLGLSNICILNVQQGSLVAFTVPPERRGMAFGLLYCCINFSYTIFPPILGVVEVHGGYDSAFFVLFMLSIFGLVMAIFMYYTDNKENNSVLQKPNPFEAIGIDAVENKSVVMTTGN